MSIPSKPLYLCTKRGFDLVVSFTGLLLFGPFIVLIWGFCAYETRSSGLFFQERIGLNGTPFNIWKFKTMISRPSARDTSVTVKGDDRVTISGRFLRKHKLDEVIQLVNVLRGEMSLVGPRPTVASDYDKMSSIQKRRQTVLPGMTGLAQVNGNTSLRWQERIKFDLYYVRFGSMSLDLGILLKTLLLVLSRKIETHPNGNKEW